MRSSRRTDGDGSRDRTASVFTSAVINCRHSQLNPFLNVQLEDYGKEKPI